MAGAIITGRTSKAIENRQRSSDPCIRLESSEAAASVNVTFRRSGSDPGGEVGGLEARERHVRQLVERRRPSPRMLYAPVVSL